MAIKFQFFTLNNDRKQYTFIDMSSSTFLKEKEALLSQGFEVLDDVIYAETSEEAVEHYKSNFIYVLEEYNKADNPFYSVLLIFESIRDYFKRK
ncbi:MULTISPECIES: hypothetical protein [Photobacterium]|uniref:Uncharacterized protein n=1 Tax=Photobacterium angustum TaxID=661 RepID=A0A2S7VLZ9_PHOAN|nr:MULTISPECIES: hypothetical protein [Photobacterium]PQJ62802.1 hypothetical protein BTO08_21570 [Photobacterium angustum]PSV26833.1 hypothetical protein C9J40_20820 [Photobacterium sp. GB-72]PSV34318.1 hypothetical protein C9J38_18460 [Photobacterium sp. GB-210]PSV38242.1 hypothetical protein C9J44_04195 [Photobacterium sp. GB-27]PSV45060.1 hypothetical protein C9J46_08305 [Photobacterium sp. GB-36]